MQGHCDISNELSLGFNIDMNIFVVLVEGAMSGASISFAAYAHNSTSSDQSRPTHLVSFANLDDHTDSDRPPSFFVSRDKFSKFDVIGREFSSIKDVEEFYFAYTKSIDFSVRKNIKRANLKGNVTIRSWTLSILRSHSFAIMKVENRSEILMCMILPHWTKDAKIPQSYLQNSSSNPSSEAVYISSLTIACQNLICFAVKIVDGYNDSIEVIRKLTLRARCIRH
ncbi:hypothetical protein WN943_010870 [Citrus x changshan-huyou]